MLLKSFDSQTTPPHERQGTIVPFQTTAYEEAIPASQVELKSVPRCECVGDFSKSFRKRTVAAYNKRKKEIRYHIVHDFSHGRSVNNSCCTHSRTKEE